MSALTQTHALRQLIETDATWRLLRAANAPVIAALLSEHLGGESRRLPTAELYERIDHDLDALRGHGFDLPQNAQGYCAEWRKSGFLTRRADEETRGETFELAPGALGAIRILEQLAAPRQTVTESRLASIGVQLSQLAIDTDPDVTRRLEQLHAQRDRIDAQIERIQQGDIDTLDPARALERVRDILAQAEEIPSDFARVRAEFENLNRDLRARIVESDDTQRTVLDEVFRGVDLIAESDEGRSFAGFSALVLDPAVGSAFDDDVARVLAGDFAADLTTAQRRFLRRFIGTLKDHSGEIHEVITAFARGLRRYVQSQDYQRDRVLRSMLRAALASGVEASAHSKPYQPTTLHLELSAVALRSVGALRLHDPAELDATAPIVEHVAGTADLEALRALARQTEIDFAELIDNVNSVLADLDQCSVREVLERHPASQGVASVVGLLTLAANQGTIPGGIETVRWHGTDQAARAADIPIYRFTGRLL
ncbi:DUF3375 domain-containing protein [Cryobacterium sp. TMS1-13-1]|uniref:DUF3375 domain-containing protein n=1 Tax=Cryobacterium sp. TMS1-13-1 TaxID=1259220 RepID=UPI00106AFF9A|nr:DUF3375 domain-containing protein [Cryobacterium sp. TMS1-13-1]TFD23034.1 DUF3375 domain-containing protein [Cryobacterium sp. TMS1-13-1]